MNISKFNAGVIKIYRKKLAFGGILFYLEFKSKPRDMNLNDIIRVYELK